MIEENSGVIRLERLHVEGADLVAEGLQAPGHVDHRGEQIVAQVNVALGEHQVLITSLIEVPEAEIHFVGAKNGLGREGCRILSMISGVVAHRAQDKILRLGADALDIQSRGEQFSLLEEGRGEDEPLH